MEHKQTIRKTYKQKRQDLSQAERLEKSQQIAQQVASLLKENPSWHHFHIFLPIERLLEVDTFPIIHELWKSEKRLYTSVTDMEKGSMEGVALHPDAGFRQGKWGMLFPEPIELVSLQQLQVVFIPLLAYDLKGNRLGYGKGHYDQFLKSLGNKPVKIGLSFFPPMERIVPEDHDIPLDMCVSPERIYYF
ncbi:5-formyltetrahydrofolate cyclo-ligase [Pararhodonellum marinum]|uniref:5-formyltetrahydrofolate cyclo-ligase n=1 Tax=Pararhodonellum marinum TaxID=2755358 RepID=UPI00189009A7|nr:5-formyltetrahydrofolate cyclo-ligase [Pararhodonellum marinum]